MFRSHPAQEAWLVSLKNLLSIVQLSPGWLPVRGSSLTLMSVYTHTYAEKVYNTTLRLAHITSLPFIYKVSIAATSPPWLVP